MWVPSALFSNAFHLALTSSTEGRDIQRVANFLLLSLEEEILEGV